MARLEHLLRDLDIDHGGSAVARSGWVYVRRSATAPWLRVLRAREQKAYSAFIKQYLNEASTYLLVRDSVVMNAALSLGH